MAEEQKLTPNTSSGTTTPAKPPIVLPRHYNPTAAKTTKVVTEILLGDADNGFRKGNFVCSPFSLEIILGMLASGAEGKTLKQLLEFLGVETLDQFHSESPCSNLLQRIFTNPNGEEGSHDSSLVKGSNLANEISLANGIWVDKTLNFIQSCYEEILRTVYRTQARFVDFGNKSESARQINSWANKKTRGLVQEIVDGNALKDVAIVLVNALYFKGIWSTQFNPYATRKKNFHLINGETVSVPFMTNDTQFWYGSFDGFKILQLPYISTAGESKNFSMYIFLPDRKDGLQDVLRLFDSDHALFHAMFNLSPQDFNELWIPKFKISYKLDPQHVMKQMGLTLPFDRMNMELTRIADPAAPDGDKLYVSNILQQSFIEVDEVGTVAYAVTTMCGGWGYTPPPRVSFVADHPFMFMIREETSRAVFFMGVVLNPNAN